MQIRHTNKFIESWQKAESGPGILILPSANDNSNHVQRILHVLSTGLSERGWSVAILYCCTYADLLQPAALLQLVVSRRCHR